MRQNKVCKILLIVICTPNRERGSKNDSNHNFREERVEQVSDYATDVATATFTATPVFKFEEKCGKVLWR